MDWQDLDQPEFAHYFVKRLVTIALDQQDREREMASSLLSTLYAVVSLAGFVSHCTSGRLQQNPVSISCGSCETVVAPSSCSFGTACAGAVCGADCEGFPGDSRGNASCPAYFDRVLSLSEVFEYCIGHTSDAGAALSV